MRNKTERFHYTQSLHEFQAIIRQIYGLHDDRFYSIWDLLAQQQRFTMRALKGVRKDDKQKIKVNILIAFSWLMATANRLHVDLEEEVWKRFPGLCSYCGQQPCGCKKSKPTGRKKLVRNLSLKPSSLAETQTMFAQIYPAKNRTIADAGVHLAEEMGEVSEAIHNYLGKHEEKLFTEIKLEMADYVSCVLGLANSVKIDVAKELAKLFRDNCHICHKAPCVCSFSSVVSLKS